MIIPNAEYVTFSAGGAQYLIPNNPGPYPNIIDPDPAVHKQQVAKHKAELLEFKTYCEMEITLRNVCEVC